MFIMFIMFMLSHILDATATDNIMAVGKGNNSLILSENPVGHVSPHNQTVTQYDSRTYSFLRYHKDQ